MSNTPLGKYYETLPTATHQTGDIWSELPTFGLIKNPYLPGIVITPACDLANNKVETISFLPILPVNSYLYSPSFWPEIRGSLLSAADQLQLPATFRNLFRDFSRIDTDSINCAKDIITQTLSDRHPNPARLRCSACLQYLIKTLSPSVTTPSHQNLSDAIGQKLFDSHLTKIVTNSYRNDIHFLPCDNQDLSWSTITSHALVLFRYPLTIPMAILDMAHSSTPEEWESYINHATMPNTAALFNPLSRPVKGLTLRGEFLHDLLTRFTCLYTRIGSPDLTYNAIQKILKDLREKAI